MSRQAVLRDHQWGFATRSVTLAAVTATDYVGWDYAYTYPIDALYASRLYNSASDDEINYTIEANEGLNKKYILTNEPNAVLIYVADAKEENLFDSLFVEALSFRIASAIIVPLKGDMALLQTMNQAYGMAIAKAKASDSNEGFKEPNTDSSLLSSRY